MEEVTMTADRPKNIKKVTLCLWIFIRAKMSEATVVSFGEKLLLKIYYGNQYKFIVNFYDWNRLVLFIGLE